MEETKLTYDQVVERYGFKKKDVDKIMKRTKPKTEVDGIRILMKEGERRLKLKKSYADRMAKKNGKVVTAGTGGVSLDSEGYVLNDTVPVGSGVSESELNNNAGEGMLNEIEMSPEQEQEAKDFDECTKKAAVKMNEIIAKNHTARARFFLGYHPITGKAQYR